MTIDTPFLFFQMLKPIHKLSFLCFVLKATPKKPRQFLLGPFDPAFTFPRALWSVWISMTRAAPQWPWSWLLDVSSSSCVICQARHILSFSSPFLSFLLLFFSIPFLFLLDCLLERSASPKPGKLFTTRLLITFLLRVDYPVCRMISIRNEYFLKRIFKMKITQKLLENPYSLGSCIGGGTMEPCKKIGYPVQYEVVFHKHDFGSLTNQYFPWKYQFFLAQKSPREGTLQGWWLGDWK